MKISWRQFAFLLILCNCCYIRLMAQRKVHTVSDLYSIAYPGDWTLEAKGEGVSLFTPRQVPGSSHRESLKVTVNHDRIVDLDEFRDAMLSEFSKAFMNYKKIAEGFKVLNEVRYSWVEITFFHNIPITNLVYVTRVQDKLITIVASTSTEKYQKNRHEFLGVINSFKVIEYAGKMCYTIRHAKADTVPRPLFSKENLLQSIHEEIRLPDSLKVRQGKVNIGFVINCEGNPVEFRIVYFRDAEGKVHRTDFDRSVIEIFPLLRQKMRYRPGWKDGYYRDFGAGIVLQFDRGNISAEVGWEQ
jgi:hypothetical protein